MFSDLPMTYWIAVEHSLTRYLNLLDLGMPTGNTLFNRSVVS